MLLCLLLAGVACAGCGRVADRFQIVEPGQLYRSGQMTTRRFENVVRKRGVRAVINLRGANPGVEWYDRERAACTSLGVAYYDLDWTKRNLPEPDSLAQFVAILEQADRPILVHCSGGTHRTGAAAACYVLLNGGTPAHARDELGLFFDDAPIGEVVTLYEAHYAREPIPFAQWVRDGYPNAYRQARRGTGRLQKGDEE